MMPLIASERVDLRAWTVGVFKIVLALCAVLSLSTVPGNSQTAGTGSVQGTIKDVTSSVIPNATVTLTEASTQVKHTAETDANGFYSFPNIDIGRYTLAVTVSGFKKYQQTGIVLEVGSSIQVNPTLAVGSVEQSVEVQAAGLALQTEDSSFKQTIDQQTLTELPLNGRQVTSLITLSGGASPAPVADIQGSKTFYSSVVISVAGGQGNATDYRLDGGDHNDYMVNINLPFPFPDALNQFSVESTALGAQEGLHPGGLVNVVTRSGSNQWHGSVFEFIRNNYLNASNFFSATKDTLHQNQYGGTFGGRVIRDKLFFFGGYQRLSASSAATSSMAYVPTAANLLGDFSVTDSASCTTTGKAIQLVNPQTGALLVNNQISTTYFNSASLALQKYLPATTSPCGLVNYAIPSRQTENQFIGRVDATLTKRHSLYGRYFLDGYTSPAYFYPNNILVTTSAGNYERAQTLTLGETYVISSKLVNSAHATATRLRDNRGPADGGINANTIGIKTFTPSASGFQLAVSGKFNTYCGTCAPGFFNVNTFAFSDDVNMIVGKHQLAWGGAFVRSQFNSTNAYESNGNFSFSGIYGQHGPTGTGGLGTGVDANLDFLTGSMSGFAESLFQQNALRAPIPSLYVQDTYHATQRLVMTAGLRWQPEYWPSDVFNRGSAFSMSNFLANVHSTVYPTSPAGTLYFGDAGVIKGYTKSSLAQFAPNFGATYDPFGKGKTVFRAGASLAYDESNFWTQGGVNQNPPYATQTANTPVGVPLSFSDPWSNGSVIGDPYPQPQRPTPAQAVFPNSGVYKVLPDRFHPLYSIQWTASIQQNFGRGWEMQIDYIGNGSRFGPIGIPLNPATYIPGTCGASACSTTGNQASRFALTIANPAQGPKYAGGGSGLVLATALASSSYNGMVATLQHRLSSTFNLLTNYTWSHCLDVSDAQGDIEGATVENPYNLRMDRANCGSDYRNIFNTTVVANSHFPLAGWKALVLNNWEIAPLLHITSGPVVNVSSGQDNSLTDIGLDRPNLVNPSVVYTRTKITRTTAGNRQYLNATAFSENAQGTYGNVGRNGFRGFNNVQFDSEISRKFPVHDRLTLDLRFEAFNVMNHPNLGNPTSSLASSTFGQVSSSAAARIFQLAAKLTF